MYIQDFIERRMQSEQFSILYDKSERNSLDLQTKEQDALNILVKEISLNFAVQISLESVRKVVDNILNAAKKSNLNDRLQQSSSTNASDENHDADILEKLNTCLDENSSTTVSKNFGEFYKPFVNHRKAVSTKIRYKDDPKNTTYSNSNAAELKSLEKRIKKMEQSLNESCRRMIEEEVKKDSATFPLILEYFLKVDPNKVEECTQKVLEDITEWFE